MGCINMCFHKALLLAFGAIVLASIPTHSYAAESANTAASNTAQKGERSAAALKPAARVSEEVSTYEVVAIRGDVILGRSSWVCSPSGMGRKSTCWNRSF